MANRVTRVLFPIGAKLVIIISILVLVSLGILTVLVSVISTQDVQRTAEDNNFTVNRRAGSQAEGFFRSIHSTALLYMEVLDRGGGSQNRDAELDRFFFERNENIAALAVLEAETVLVPNEAYLFSRGISTEALKSYFVSGGSRFDSADLEEGIKLFNASPVFQTPLLTMILSRSLKAGGAQTLGVLFSPGELTETFGTGANASFLINQKGEVLLHPDPGLMLGGADFSRTPMVASMLNTGNDDRQVSYTGEEGREFFGAHYQIPRMDAVVITTIPYSVVFEAVKSVTWQNIWLTAAVICIAVLFVWFFSKTISSPMRNLTAAALRIEQGEFEVDLKPKSHDELGLLTESFGKMSSALSIFGRFTNRDIAVRAMRGEIKPGGLPKHATIFFSDIRGFTEKSENFTKAFGDDASNRIVHWLNEYFTRMVDCVEKTGGVVDKFIGDAVMAHWGTAFTAGSPQADAFNCVKAALMMRQALLEINGRRAKNDPGNPEIRIGCGINTGVVTAGQIGSDQRMEYTVIGDPVNLASRTEALNKPLGTDILITEDTWNLVGGRIITQEMPPVTVKGKAKPVRMFAVINLKDAPDGPKTMSDVRTLLNIAAPNIDKVNTDAEEKKIHHSGRLI
jgi:adenylate cyclase